MPNLLLLLSQVRLAEPPNEPLLLNCTWPLLPPGDVEAIVAHCNAALPLVHKTCPAEPSAVG